MRALVQVEKWLGLSVMIIVPAGAAAWLALWIFDSPDRIQGMLATLGIFIAMGFLYWRLKNLSLDNDEK